jgi:ABC-type xylose transport system permease subunit
MFANRNLLAGLTFLAFGALTLVVLIPYGVQAPLSVQYRALSPSYWPNIVAVATCLIGFTLAVSAVIRGRDKEPEQSAKAHAHEVPDIGQTGWWLALRPYLALVICFALYFGLEPLGFDLTTAIAVMLLMVLAEENRLRILLPISVMLPLGLHLFFTKVASVPIPMGILEPLLLRL